MLQLVGVRTKIFVIFCFFFCLLQDKQDKTKIYYCIDKLYFNFRLLRAVKYCLLLKQDKTSYRKDEILQWLNPNIAGLFNIA